MGVLADWQLSGSIVKPFEEGLKREGKISYGCSSYGYDARIGYKFKVFTPVHCGEVDPKNFDERSFVEVDLTPCEECREIDEAGYPYWPCSKHPQELVSSFVRIPPNSFALGETVEEFDIPRDCLALVVGKSTYARCGIIVNVTPLEPEWRGKVTVEISNTTPLPARIYAGEGIMQVLFFRSDGITLDMWNLLKSHHPASLDARRDSCTISYADKRGKYQDQLGIEHPKVD